MISDANPEPTDRELLLREWETKVHPIEIQWVEADKAAVEYSLLGIKNAFLLNGGGLVIMPAITTIFKVSPSDHKTLLVFAAALFTLGIVCAAAATTFSYFLRVNNGIYHKSHREDVACSLIVRYYGEEKAAPIYSERIDSAKKKKAESNEKSNRLRSIAIASLMTSGALFIGASATLLYIAWS